MSDPSDRQPTESDIRNLLVQYGLLLDDPDAGHSSPPRQRNTATNASTSMSAYTRGTESVQDIVSEELLQQVRTHEPHTGYQQAHTHTPQLMALLASPPAAIQPAAPHRQSSTLATLEAQIALLKAQLANTTNEVDILKDAIRMVLESKKADRNSPPAS